jgi:hypothetical protein
MPMSLAAMDPPARVTVAPSPRSWCVHGPHDPRRAEVEAFIAGVFAERFDAQVRQFAPMLVAVRDADGIVAAAGYRAAAEAPLFLERYLGAPVETLLAAQVGSRPAREHIVEVGHLAAARAGEGRRLIRALGVHLAGLGHEWVVSTLTEELRQLFVRIGVTPLALGHADPALLGEDASCWGHYYEHRPVVLAGQLRQALVQLARREARGGDAA